jgi:hypothetical protein
MKNVMYHYNGVEGEEELHEDEKIEKLKEGCIIERAGEHWKILELRSGKTSESVGIENVRIFLEGPKP